MKSLNIDDYIRKVPDFPKKGVLFYDISGILTAHEAFNYCIDSMAEMYKDKDISAIAAIEARGFLFASFLLARGFGCLVPACAGLGDGVPVGFGLSSLPLLRGLGLGLVFP